MSINVSFLQTFCPSTSNSTVDDDDYIYNNYEDYESTDTSAFRAIEHFLTKRFVVAICVLGLLGNFCNLFFLVPIGLRPSLARIERCAYTGLVALAVSDLCFCLFVIPNAWTVKTYEETSFNFNLLYAVYNNALINISVLTSTWLTVTMAIGRYVAICHPLWAREIIGPTIAKRSIAIVVVVCIAMNIPRFWVNEIIVVPCSEDLTLYFINAGVLQRSDIMRAVYHPIYFIVGIAIPFVVLVSSNICLIRALRRSQSPGLRNRHTDRADPNRVITLTMVIIIIMYILLVTPAETIHFLQNYASDYNEGYDLLVAVVNSLQAINFAFNVILYFAINVSFRRCVFRMLCCCTRRADPKRRLSNFQSTASTTLTRSQRRTINANTSYTVVTSAAQPIELH